MSPEQLIEGSLVERFRVDLEALTDRPPTGDRPLGVAVSGGGDSLALLLLAQEAYPGAVWAVTVNHRLRPEAAAEAAFVESLCAARGILQTTLEPDPDFDVSTLASVQQRARAIRYQRLSEWSRRFNISAIALAHQRDDVAESFLMRAARGSGIRGLAAMPRARPLHPSKARLVRPLLEWTRTTLAGIVAAAGIEPVFDPSNADPRYDRSRVRRLLAESTDLPSERLARAAHNLRDAADAIQWMLEREWPERVVDHSPDEVRVRTGGLPFELKRQLAIGAIEELRSANALRDHWRQTGVADLVRRLNAGYTGMIADVQAVPAGEHWTFRIAPPRRSG